MRSLCHRHFENYGGRLGGRKWLLIQAGAYVIYFPGVVNYVKCFNPSTSWASHLIVEFRDTRNYIPKFHAKLRVTEEEPDGLRHRLIQRLSQPRRQHGSRLRVSTTIHGQATLAPPHLLPQPHRE